MNEKGQKTFVKRYLETHLRDWLITTYYCYKENMNEKIKPIEAVKEVDKHINFILKYVDKKTY